MYWSAFENRDTIIGATVMLFMHLLTVPIKSMEVVVVKLRSPAV
jgi:hypothetical protein